MLEFIEFLLANFGMFTTEDFAFPFIETKFFHIFIGKYKTLVDSASHMKLYIATFKIAINARAFLNLTYCASIIISS
jgi:hypothetical protein